MFRPVRMMQLRAVVLERDLRLVLRVLGEAGTVEVRRTAPGPDTAPLCPLDYAGDVARCEQLVGEVEQLRQALGLTPPKADAPHSPELTLMEAERGLRSIAAQAEALLTTRKGLSGRLRDLDSLRAKTACYRGLGLPLGPERSPFLSFVTGSVPAGDFDTLQRQVVECAAVLPLPKREGRQPLLALTTPRGRAALEAVLAQLGFEPEALPAHSGTTVDILDQSSLRELATVRTDLREVNDKLRSLAIEARPALAAIERAASVERRLLEVQRNFPRTENAALLTGWVPADSAAALRERLSAVTVGRCVLRISPPEGTMPEEIPVLLRHGGVLHVFGELVRAYGMPNYQEVEPTVFVALSYLAMFGMMFGDVGHGAVLAAGGLLVLGAGRARKLHDAGVLLLLGGLASMAFGAVYGSYFGLPQLKRYALWQDPLEGNPMTLMSTALSIGLGLLSLGLILNIINRFRRRDVLGALLDKFGLTGLVFYWGALALLVEYENLKARGLAMLSLVLFLGLPLVGWSLKGPVEFARSRRRPQSAEASGGLGEVLTESAVGAFEAVLSYLANTVSFVRLAAYAMSHAALLAAAFLMAAEVRRLSFGGAALGVLVVVAGNLVALLLEGVVASVQALRLEYYEFFGKFFSGDGRAFEPFRLRPVPG